MLDLNSSATSRSREELRSKKNKPEYVEGYSPEEAGAFFGDNMFDEMDSDFGSTGNSGGGADNTFSTTDMPFDMGQGQGQGQPNTFNQNGNPFPSPFQQPQAQQAPVEKKPDIGDELWQYTENSFMLMGKILIEIVNSLKIRSAGDIGYFFSNVMKASGLLGALGVIAVVIGKAAGNSYAQDIIGMMNIFTAVVMLGFGFGGFFLAAYILVVMPPRDNLNLDNMQDASDTSGMEDHSEDAEKAIDDIWAALTSGDDDEDDFGEDFGEDAGDESEFDSSSFLEEEFEKYTPENEGFDLEKVYANQILNRANLVDTFVRFLPLNNPGFSIRKNMQEGSEDFETIEALCMRALGNVMKKEIEDVDSQLNSAVDGFFDYELRVQRPRGMGQNKCTELARELEIYFRKDAKQLSVNAEVVMERDEYKITIIKGNKAVVTMGDVMKIPEVDDFIRNEKHALPFVAGITPNGEVILEDAKILDSMLIAGQSRSGKSWYMISLLMNMMMWNPPDDIALIIVDPKKSNLLARLGLLPHVLGVHNEVDAKTVKSEDLVQQKVMAIMEELIEVEGPRRKKLFMDYGVDDIWAFREVAPAIKLPVIYLVIDEVMTLKGSMGDGFKEFNAQVNVIMTQLPSAGIRVLLIPHRATGVIEKTTRTQIKFFAAVRSTNEEVMDTLGLKKWDIQLVNPGDTAMMGSERREMFVRGAAVETTDGKLSAFITNVAKAFYKMGVDMPETGHLVVSRNRDPNKIREILGGTNNMEQFDADNVFDSVDGEDKTQSFGYTAADSGKIESKDTPNQAEENEEYGYNEEIPDYTDDEYMDIEGEDEEEDFDDSLEELEDQLFNRSADHIFDNL